MSQQMKKTSRIINKSCYLTSYLLKGRWRIGLFSSATQNATFNKVLTESGWF